MSEREKILERIRQLRQMTTGRGCTEAEAMAAAAKVAELMARLGVSEADVAIEEASSILQGARHVALVKLWGIIGHCTNTSLLRVARGRADGVIFFGAAPGPEIAAYLRDVCDRAVGRELALFKAGAFYRRRRSTKTRRAAIADFLDGLIERLARRLLHLFASTVSQRLLDAAVAARDSRYPETSEIALREREVRFPDAKIEGYRAGARPNLSHGVGGGDGGPVGLIGRAP